MNKKNILLIILLTILPFWGTSQTLTAYRNTVSNGYNFWVCTPKDYDSLQSETPIVLFLHGASLCGNNLERVRRYGPLDALAMGRQIDALIIAPQNPGGAWNPERINNIVDWVYEHYAGDTNRLYVLGMSLGGYGTIDYSAAHSERVAAAMALCGGGNPKSYCGLNELPLWIIHGTADKIVPYGQIALFNLRFMGSDVISRTFRKNGCSYRIFRYQGNSHEVAGSMPENVPMLTSFIEENVMTNTRVISDSRLTDPRIPVKNWGKGNYKKLYK